MTYTLFERAVKTAQKGDTLVQTSTTSWLDVDSQPRFAPSFICSDYYR